jgi:glyoxylase-like metal-dependent hydrolase (beta-lactamase superfamily II)
MRTRTLTPTLIQLTRLRFVNAFLVREDDGFTLVDTTLGRGAADDLLGAARAAGGTIRRIALTHGHVDHVGGLDALRAQLPQAQVLMPTVDAQIHAGEAFAEKKPPGSWPSIETRPDVRLEPRDRVGSLEVVATPGHTPGHVAFVDTRDRTVIGGDVFTSYGKLAVTNHFNIRFPLAAPATWDKARDRESARAIRALEPTLLTVGHGPPVHDPLPAIDRALADA